MDRLISSQWHLHCQKWFLKFVHRTKIIGVFKENTISSCLSPNKTHARTAQRDHVLARIGNYVCFEFMKWFNRTRTHLFGTGEDVEENHTEIELLLRTVASTPCALVLGWSCIRFSLGFHLWCRRRFFFRLYPVMSGFSSAWRGAVGLECTSLMPPAVWTEPAVRTCSTPPPGC